MTANPSSGCRVASGTASEDAAGQRHVAGRITSTNLIRLSR
ncbi:hypothetical protein ACS15_4445 [Ralstonia insidiosa]|uniref:Uncharacterized protein n=1 Tax=Ralstonia insidiosa TaxID=190721 RepID=A0AAC9FSU9_9RALS|nr:hypothetical protein ACS15_4445 [Ralstonia insidiosa]